MVYLKQVVAQLQNSIKQQSQGGVKHILTVRHGQNLKSPSSQRSRNFLHN